MRTARICVCPCSSPILLCRSVYLKIFTCPSSEAQSHLQRVRPLDSVVCELALSKRLHAPSDCLSSLVYRGNPYAESPGAPLEEIHTLLYPARRPARKDWQLHST